MRILYEDNHLIVALKPHNIPSQGDSSGDEDMLTILKAYIKEKYNKPGNVFLGLVHRLDRPTAGVMVFARTSKAAERLSKQFLDHKVTKEYTALINGVVPVEGELNDHLIKDNVRNIVSVCDSSKGKPARLSYKRVALEGANSRVKINLYTGRSHQIRVQFSSRGWPLMGDAKYGSGGRDLCLFCTKLGFYHPITKEYMEFSAKEDF